MCLFAFALTLLLEPEPSQDAEVEDEDAHRPLRFRPPEQIPKVALMGKGEGSGRGKWKVRDGRWGWRRNMARF
jgi:hypothetical protein